MKIHSTLLMLVITLFILAGCASHSAQQNMVNQNYVPENWVNEVNISSKTWLRGVDPWFLTGAPDPFAASTKAPPYAAFSTMNVNVGVFDSIIVNGPFQVQIVGGTSDAVYVLGPNEAVREISIQSCNGVLRINQAKNPKFDLSRVIIRICARNLHNISNIGKAQIYGRGIISDHLSITACDCGSVVLSGRMNVAYINQQGTGNIIVIGAVSPSLIIDAPTNGNVYVCGRVGIQKIAHTGNGCVNVIGAESKSLSILAANESVTVVIGCVNLKHIKASDKSRVYVYPVQSQALGIIQTDSSRVGLAGKAANVNLDLADNAHFGGQYLHIGSLYIQTRGAAHANVTPDIKMFASTANNSSVYVFASPPVTSKYSTGNSVILPIWNDTAIKPIPRQPVCCVEAPQVMFK